MQRPTWRMAEGWQRGALVLVALLGTLALGLSARSPALADELIGSCSIVSDPTPTHLSYCPAVDLYRHYLAHQNLNYAVLDYSDLFGASALLTTLHGADLSHTRLAYATFSYADLTDANLTGANLSSAQVFDTNLRGANFSDANVGNVNWQGVTCPDGTNSDNNGRTCAGHLVPSGGVTVGVQMSSSFNPANPQQAITFTATVAAICARSGQRVLFFDSAPDNSLDNIRVLADGILNAAGQATSTTSSLAAGQHRISAFYVGDNPSQFGGPTSCRPAASATLLQVVNATPAPISGLLLTSSKNPSPEGQPVTFTASLGCFKSGKTVSFIYEHGTLGTGTIATDGQATFTTSSLAPGQHFIIAFYGGDTICPLVTSAQLTQVVNSAPAPGDGVLLTSSANPSAAGQPVTFTASLTCSGYLLGGLATFLDGSTTLGTALVNPSGQASLDVKTLTAGRHTITASVSGSSCGTLASAPLTQSVR